MQLVKENWRPWLIAEAKGIALYAPIAALIYWLVTSWN